MEKIKLEQREQLPAIVKILTGNELIEKIYQGQSLPQNPKFLPFEKGGAFKYFNLSDLTGIRGTEGKLYPLLEINGEVIGLSELEEQPNNPGNFWIKFISIDPQFQGKGCASQLAEEIFYFAQEHGFSLETSMYSQEGAAKLRPKFIELANRYSVEFHDTED